MAWERSFDERAERINLRPGTRYNVYVYPSVIRKRWNVSDRRNGSLVLKPQACDMQYSGASMREFPTARGDYVPTPSGADGRIYFPSTHMSRRDPNLVAEATNRARSRFMGKTRADTASMGITLATWKQSRDMIFDRSKTLASLLRKEEELQRSLSRSRAAARWSKDKGNLYLEGLFGWMPLFQDISDAAAVITDPLVDQWIRASAQVKTTALSPTLPNGSSSYGYRTQATASGSVRVTIASKVEVSNPNLWLANRLGLLAAPAVAVDLIPWSWVVGMFWNQSQFVGQLTDTLGLKFTDMSITTTTRGHLDWKVVGTGGYAGAYAQGTCFERLKSRVLSNSLPPVRPMARVPEMSWGLAATALALVAQRAERIHRFGVTLQKSIRTMRREETQ